MNQYTCPFCSCELDDQLKSPLLIRNCGHYFCEICIQAMISKAKILRLNFIKCPVCDEQSSFLPDDQNLYDSFPKNTALLKELIPILAKTYCQIHKDKKKRYICVSPDCGVKERFCSECCKTHPSNCQRKLILDEETFWTRVKFKDTSLKPSCSKEILKKTVKIELINLENYIMAMIESYNFKINEDIKKIDRFMNVRDLFLANKDNFRYVDSSNLTEVSFEYKHETLYQRFIQNMYDIFNTRIWFDVYKSINSHFFKFIDENKDGGTAMFPEQYELLLKLSGMNPLIRNELILANFKTTKWTSFEKYFHGIRGKLNNLNVKFQETDSKLFDKDMKFFAQRCIQKAFNQNVVTPDSVAFSISNDFNQEYKNGFLNFVNGNRDYTWHVVLDYSSFNPPKLGTKYIRLKNDRFLLTIFTKE